MASAWRGARRRRPRRSLTTGGISYHPMGDPAPCEATARDELRAVRSVFSRRPRRRGAPRARRELGERARRRRAAARRSAAAMGARTLRVNNRQSGGIDFGARQEEGRARRAAAKPTDTLPREAAPGPARRSGRSASARPRASTRPRAVAFDEAPATHYSETVRKDALAGMREPAWRRTPRRSRRRRRRWRRRPRSARTASRSCASPRAARCARACCPRAGASHAWPRSPKAARPARRRGVDARRSLRSTRARAAALETLRPGRDGPGRRGAAGCAPRASSRASLRRGDEPRPALADASAAKRPPPPPPRPPSRRRPAEPRALRTASPRRGHASGRAATRLGARMRGALVTRAGGSWRRSSPRSIDGDDPSLIKKSRNGRRSRPSPARRALFSTRRLLGRPIRRRPRRRRRDASALRARLARPPLDAATAKRHARSGKAPRVRRRAARDGGAGVRRRRSDLDERSCAAWDEAAALRDVAAAAARGGPRDGRGPVAKPPPSPRRCVCSGSRCARGTARASARSRAVEVRRPAPPP